MSAASWAGISVQIVPELYVSELLHGACLGCDGVKDTRVRSFRLGDVHHAWYWERQHGPAGGGYLAWRASVEPREAAGVQSQRPECTAR